MIRTLIVLSIMFPGLAIAVVNRYAALLLYVWFALFRPQEWVWIDISFLRLSLLTGVLLVLPAIPLGIFPNFTHPLSVGTMGFMVAAFVSHLVSYRPAVSGPWVEFFVRLAIVCMLAITLVSTRDRFRLFVAVIAGSLGFHAAKAGFFSLVSGGVRFAEGLAGAWADNNGYAVGMAMVTPLLLATAQNYDNKWVKRAFLLAAPLSLFSVISTFSRGGFLSLTGSVLVFVMLQRRRLPALIGLGVLAVPVGVFMVSQPGYLDRLSTIQSYEETNEKSALGRLYFWTVAVRMAQEHPLGVGLFNFESAYNEFDITNGEYGPNRSVHSSHFQVLSEAGFIGVVAWLFLWATAFICAFRIRGRGARSDLSPEDRRMFTTYANALIASMTAFMIGGSFVSMALNDLTWLTFAVLASLDLISKAACEAAAVAPAATDAGAAAAPALAVPVPVPISWVPPRERIARAR
jgi:putative inorganic carbon (HCO3(-)) transporter